MCGLCGGFRPPTTGSLSTSYNICRPFLPWGFRPPTTGSSCTLSTSYNICRPFLPSVHIDGGGGGGGDDDDDDGGGAVLFFGFKIECSRDLPRSIVFHSFTPVLHIFTMYVFTLPYIVSYYLSVAGIR